MLVILLSALMSLLCVDRTVFNVFIGTESIGLI